MASLSDSYRTLTTVASSIRRIDQISQHFRKLQVERDIPQGLVDEAIEDGLVLEGRRNSKLVVTDNIILICSPTRELRPTLCSGVDLYCHELRGEWKGCPCLLQTHVDEGVLSQREVSAGYFFFQVFRIENYCLLSLLRKNLN